MKMKHLVLGTLCLTLCAGTGWAKPKILDGSLAGWWRFDNSADYREDSSGYGSPINSDISNGTTASSGGYSGGKINLGKSKTFTATLADSAPAIPGTTMPYYTFAIRFKSGDTIISGFAAWLAPQALKDVLNDTGSWHFSAMRYQNKSGSSDPNTGGGQPYGIFLDPQYSFGNGRTSSGDLELTSASSSDFLMKYSGKTITIGGSVNGYSWWGDLDEVMVFTRMLTKGELTRLRYTGESYVFSNSTTPSFTASSNWSSNENTVNLKPGDAFGTPYIVENGQTMTQGGTATFGADMARHVSLTLGRKAEVSYMDGASAVTRGVTGNFNHSSAGTLTFYDLRFVNGTYTAAGTGLATSLLDVDTPTGSVFNFNVTSSDYALNVTEDTTGDGVLAKRGSGKLTVGKWTGTAKLRLAEGSIKTPRLDGYTGGTVIVDDDPVTFTGADTLSGTIQVQYTGTIAAAEATYPVLNAPTLTSAGQVAISAAIPEKYEGAPKLENGVVSLVVTKKVAPLPDEDKGTKPVLLWQ